MKTLTCLALTLLSVSFVHADEAGPKAPTSPLTDTDAEVARMQGVWKPVGAILSGNRLPPPALKAITLTVSGNKYEVVVEGEDHADRGTFAVDVSTTPRRLTLKSQEGPNKGKTFLAIYETKSPTAMRVCYDLSGQEFPTDFKAPKDSSLYIAGYRKQPSTKPTAGTAKHIVISIHGADVRIALDDATYDKWRKQFGQPRSSQEERHQFDTIMSVVRAAYVQGRQDVRTSDNLDDAFE